MRRLSQIAADVGGDRTGEDVDISSVAIDSRDASEGGLFVALGGSRQDGHAFVKEAHANGVRAALVSDRRALSGPGIVVPDTLAALSALAAAERRRTTAKVIGITGSSGKTTTKDLLTAVLSKRFGVHASQGSYNNEVGLPLTILEAGEATEFLVCEMGSRGIGHIAALCEVAQPDVGIVTNVGVAHLELFGSMENVAKAKSELVSALGSGGVAILFEDDPVVRGFSDLVRGRTLTFGTSERSDVRALDVSLEGDGRASFRIVAYGDSERVRLPVPGEHMVPNALAATAAGLAVGIALEECAGALEQASISRWRMETSTTSDGITVVNDAYNANPASMAAALRTARWMAKGGRLAAVLGQMAELGSVALEEHERIGEMAARLGVERVVTVGREARPLAMAALREGLEPSDVASYDDPDEALADIRAWLKPGDVVLFKGSRVVGLDRLAEALR